MEKDPSIRMVLQALRESVNYGQLGGFIPLTFLKQKSIPSLEKELRAQERKAARKQSRVWTEHEDEQLRLGKNRGLFVGQLAAELGRNPAVVEARLVKLGLLHRDEIRLGSDNGHPPNGAAGAIRRHGPPAAPTQTGLAGGDGSVAPEGDDADQEVWRASDPAEEEALEAWEKYHTHEQSSVVDPDEEARLESLARNNEDCESADEESQAETWEESDRGGEEGPEQK